MDGLKWLIVLYTDIQSTVDLLPVRSVGPKPLVPDSSQILKADQLVCYWVSSMGIQNPAFSIWLKVLTLL